LYETTQFFLKLKKPNQAVEDTIGCGGIADLLVPACDGKL